GRLPKEAAMRGHDPVTGFRDRRDTRNALVEPQHPFPARSVGQRSEDSFRPAEYLCAGHDELHGFTKILEGNFRKLIGGFLERRVGDTVSRQSLPIVHPEPAKAAVTVVDE